MNQRRFLAAAVALVAALAVACSQAVSTEQPSGTAARPTIRPETLLPVATPTTGPRFDEAEAPGHLTGGWNNTDFSKRSVPFSEISNGGPPRDGIRPIDTPRFVDVSEDPQYMRRTAPVISVEIDGDARAYPLAILTQHEIVNDVVGGTSVTVTYCPLCNTAIVFDRRLDHLLLNFGTTGKLRNSDLVMWDRQTESWWQQITGEAIVGELTGKTLTMIPASIVPWEQFREAFPDGKLLSRDQGFIRQYNYDLAPYSGSDDSGPYYFTPGLGDKRLSAMERVLTLQIGEEAFAYPFTVLGEHNVVNDTVGVRDIVIFYLGGTDSPFTDALGMARDVGSTAVFDARLDGRKLTFAKSDGKIVDEETGSSWDLFGRAVEGTLEGMELTPVLHANHFWFAWASFHPDTAVIEINRLARTKKAYGPPVSITAGFVGRASTSFETHDSH